jgi:hypothetical protein
MVQRGPSQKTFVKLGVLDPCGREALTEGLDIADLKDAKTLLDELR